jgi:hypothetical protein
VTVQLNIYITDVDKDPVAGVVVKVYSADGATSITEGLTDIGGYVGLEVEVATYQLRFYKQHWSFGNPKSVMILSGQPNTFDISAVDVTPPTPTDARLCAAYGHFRDITGRALRGAKIHFTPKFKPFLLEGSAVLTGNVTVTTDADGYARIDLVRFAQYDVTVSAEEDYAREVWIPDAVRVNLPDLLFPLVTEITFTPPLPATLPLSGAEFVTTPTIKLSDGRTGTMGDVQWSSSDSDVVAVLPSATTLTLRPLGLGLADVQAVRADNSIVRIPDPGIAGVPVTVDVT